jgi:hypothetical protein
VASHESRQAYAGRRILAGASAGRHGGYPRSPLCTILVVAVVFLCGCAGTTVTASQAKLSPVALRLNAGSYSLSASSTTISGTAARGARVAVNGHRVSNHAGHWGRTLHLHLGENRITVRATLSGHAASRRTIAVTREKTGAEVEAETKEQEASSQPSTPTSTPPPEEACTNGTYVNSAGNTVCRPENSPTAPAGATAECADGTYSFSESRSGTCSHHGGVARWLE